MSSELGERDNTRIWLIRPPLQHVFVLAFAVSIFRSKYLLEPEGAKDSAYLIGPMKAASTVYII
jgi:hypothetical protein